MNENAGRSRKIDRLRPRRGPAPWNPPSSRQHRGSQGASHLARLGGVLGGILDGLAVLDKSWHYTYVNEAAAALLQTTPDQLIGRVVWPTFPRSWRAQLRCGLARVVEQKAAVRFEAFYEPLGRWYECRCYPHDDGLTVLFTDMTSYRQTEEASREREERYRSFFADDLTGDFIATPDGKMIECNPAFAEIYGFADPAQARQCDISCFNPEDWTELIARVRKEHRVQAHGCIHHRPDGQKVWVVASVVGRFTDAGELTEVRGYVFDDTERKQAEEALRESEQRFRAVLENSLDIAYRRDLRTDGYDYISPVVERTIGFTPAEMSRFRTEDVLARIHPDDAERVKQEFAEAVKGDMGTIEYRFRCKDGTYRWLADYFVVQKDEAGRPFYLSGNMRNITGFKQGEEALRQSEQRFKSTFENAAVGITHIGLDGRFLRCNSRFCEITGYDSEELEDKTFQELTHPDDLQAEMSRRKRLERGEIARYSIEKRYIRRDGAGLWVNLTVSAQRDDAGRIEYFIAIVQDISRRKQIEELLRDNEQRLRLALEGAQMGRWEWDVQTDGTFWDERVCELLGVDKHDPATRTILFSRVDGRDRSLLEELLRKALAEQEDFQTEFRVVHAGGEILWLAVRGRVIRDTRGRAVRMMGVMYDATQRKRMEDDLRRWNDQLENEVSARTEELRHTVDRLHDEGTRRALAEGRLRQRSRMLEAFFQHTIAPLAFLDQHFNFVRVNEAYAKADGKSPEYFVGKNFFTLYPGVENRTIFERVVRTRQSYRAYARAFVFPDAPQPGPTYWNWWLTPLLNEAGEVQFLVLNLEDVTERQHAFSELQERTHQLQQLTLELSEAEDRERKRLAEILHDDLQQMLAAAKFHVGLLSNRAKGDEELQKMAGEVKEMLKDAIEKSRSLSRELHPPGLSHSDLHETLEWLAQQMQTKHGLTVHLDARGQIELRSEALKSFLYKAVQEMLFNVIKHARVKEARLRLRRRHQRIYLAVSDKGRGFDPQAAGNNSGFGLLSIRERVKLLGGRVKVKSARGKGSVFVIAVPDSGPPTARSGGQKAEDPDRLDSSSSGADPSSSNRILRVLLADDHKIVRQGLKSMLTDEPDIEVVGEAGNGREAVDLAYQLQPDVVVMDVSMPVMAGDEATRQIKLYLPRTRIIALSMHDDTRVADRMRKVGAAAYLLKTAPSEDLLAAIRGT